MLLESTSSPSSSSPTSFLAPLELRKASTMYITIAGGLAQLSIESGAVGMPIPDCSAVLKEIKRKKKLYIYCTSGATFELSCFPQ